MALIELGNLSKEDIDRITKEAMKKKMTIVYLDESCPNGLKRGIKFEDILPYLKEPIDDEESVENAPKKSGGRRR